MYWRQCEVHFHQSHNSHQIQANFLHFLEVVCGNTASGSNLSLAKEFQLPWLRCLQLRLQSSTTVSVHALNTLYSEQIHIYACAHTHTQIAYSLQFFRTTIEEVLMSKEIEHLREEWQRQEKINHRYCFPFFIFLLLFNIQPFSAWIMLPSPLLFILSHVSLFPPGAQWRNCPIMLLQVRQHKQHHSVDLGIEVCLRASVIKAFSLLDYFTHSFPLTPSVIFTRSWLCFPAVRSLLAWEGPAENLTTGVVPVLAVTSVGCHRSMSLGVPQHLFPPTSIISRIFPHFQDLPYSQDLHLHTLGPLFSFPDHFCFLGTFLFSTTSSFCDPCILLVLI